MTLAKSLARVRFRPRADLSEEIGRRIAASPKQPFMETAAFWATRGLRCGLFGPSLHCRCLGVKAARVDAKSGACLIDQKIVVEALFAILRWSYARETAKGASEMLRAFVARNHCDIYDFHIRTDQILARKLKSRLLNQLPIGTAAPFEFAL